MIHPTNKFSTVSRYLGKRQDSKKLRKLLGRWNGGTEKIAELGEHFTADADGKPRVPSKEQSWCQTDPRVASSPGIAPVTQFRPLTFPPYREHPGFSCISALRPQKQQNQVGGARTSCLGTDPSVETVILKGHTQKS